MKKNRKIISLLMSCFLFILISYNFAFAEGTFLSTTTTATTSALSIKPSVIFTVNCSESLNNINKCPRNYSASIPAGYMTLMWQAKNAISCVASDSGNTSKNWSGDKPTSGAVQIFSGLSGVVSYKMTCYSSDGNSVNSSIFVSVLQQNTTNSGINTINNGTLTNTQNDALNTTSAASVSASKCIISGSSTLKDIIMNFVIGCILTRSAYLIVALAFVVFFLGVFKFIRASSEDKQEGKEFMFWGVVGIAVMLSLWGIIATLQGIFLLR